MRKNFTKLFSVGFLCFSMYAFGQQKPITGKVVDSNGYPVQDAYVYVEGQDSGVYTDGDGNYTIQAQPGDTISVEFIGFDAKNVVVKEGANYNIKLNEGGSVKLESIVATALGINRQKRDLGYSTTKVSSEDLVQSEPLTVATGMQGKVAGMNISSLNSGVFNDVKINLRGIRSLTGNNDPLLVIDGVPVALNLLNSINPNDVEDVNVLKGSSAAGIYGPDARNGAIIVTTKAGTKESKPQISISFATQYDQVAFFPKFQERYGQGGHGEYIGYENWSWGPEFDGSEKVLGKVLPDGSKQVIKYSPIKNNREGFFNTGVTNQTNVSYSAKDFYLSLQDVNINGVVPGDKNRRTGVRLNASKTYNKFTATFNSNYIQSNYDVFDGLGMAQYYADNNTGGSDGLMALIFNTQADIPLSSYKDFRNNPFATYNNYYNEYVISPYVALDTWRETGRVQDFVSNLNFKLEATDWLDLNYRAAISYVSKDTENTSKRVVANEFGLERGLKTLPQNVGNYLRISNRLSSEAFLNVHKQFGDFKIDGVAGTYLREVNSRNANLKGSNLLIEGLYNVSARPGELGGYSNQSKTRMLSFYGSIGLKYQNFISLEVTGRNDKVSVLNPQHNSFFYPGASLSVVLTDAIPAIKSDYLNFLKLRASWNKTGNADISPYSLDATFSQVGGFPFNGLPGYSADAVVYDPLLKPEFIETKEFGFEAAILKDRITLDATYYYQNNTDQIVSIRVPRSTGYIFAKVNAASFNNYGFETQLNITPLFRVGDFRFNIGANFAYNNNEVTSIYKDLNELAVGGYVAAANQVVKGEPAYVFSAKDYKRTPDGKVIVDANTGTPIIDEGNKTFGRTLPLYTFGMSPTIKWNGLTVSAVFEYKGGHYTYSGIGPGMAWTGVSDITAANSRERFVFPNSAYEDPANPGKYINNENITIADTNNFWTSDNYRKVGTNFITSAASWRWRELSITYDFPKRWLSKQDLIKDVTVGIVGRNLMIWLPESNVYGDPDFKGSNSFLSGNITGISNATVNPPVRTLGGTVTFKF